MFGVYPIVTNVLQATSSKFYTNSSGQIPDITGFRGLVDRDTPDNVLTRIGFDGHEYTLVFSDEFEQEGRTFNEGDDPYWTAIDSHYCEANTLSMAVPTVLRILTLCCLSFPSLFACAYRCYQ